ncbi:MAG: TIGR01777 family oxidoreductase [Planctomycetales bacterium]|nr:TIGR01777 family oxidoreductase [Planctomycetales bacterium]
MPSTILVTGSTGLIGSRLVASFEAAGNRVLRAVRRKPRSDEELRWDPAAGEIELGRLNDVDAVVHLAGANIAGSRWSKSYKQLLLDSRTQGTRLLCETLAALDPKPRVLACASAIGFYGDRGDVELDETSSGGEGFLPELCMQWERACQPARDAGIRVVNMRIGVVLSSEGGALAKMLLPFKLGAGGILGSGQQYFSWIALDDVIGAIETILANDQVAGPVNLVSPQPVTNRDFTKTLGRVLSRPTVLPMPAFVARLAVGEMADALLLGGARVLPKVLVNLGYQFQQPALEPALRHLLRK